MLIQFTAAMINNYVKHKVILSPVKKKYQIMQLADIIVISLLKPSYPLDKIRQGIDQVTATGLSQASLRQFYYGINESTSSSR
ncbi:hypothetical protein S101258_01485 [Lactiplantibacillus plantarum subsp. plantarum]|uniref:Uncharacterized protein n=1 Tax=Lactiplantibacillus plantarum subsp. plantarum TaxID=337330 RepID=A0A2S3U653_LACPN|nr:hypothetical protein S101258_01485 [Lactiplantibacillus plantarum subsp. plantarum]